MLVLYAQLNLYSQQVRGCGCCPLLHSTNWIERSWCLPWFHWPSDWTCAWCGLDKDASLACMCASILWARACRISVFIYLDVCVCVVPPTNGLQWIEHGINIVHCNGSVDVQVVTCPSPLFFLSFLLLCLFPFYTLACSSSHHALFAFLIFTCTFRTVCSSKLFLL